MVRVGTLKAYCMSSALAWLDRKCSPHSHSHLHFTLITYLGIADTPPPIQSTPSHGKVCDLPHWVALLIDEAGGNAWELN